MNPAFINSNCYFSKAYFLIPNFIEKNIYPFTEPFFSFINFSLE